MADELDWADIIRNQIQLIDELLLVDLQILERVGALARKAAAAVPGEPDTLEEARGSNAGTAKVDAS